MCGRTNPAGPVSDAELGRASVYGDCAGWKPTGALLLNVKAWSQLACILWLVMTARSKLRWQKGN